MNQLSLWWPQITRIVFMVLFCVTGIICHGQQRKVSAWVTFVRVSALCFLLTKGGFFASPSSAAETIPNAAKQHRAVLVRSAHAVWGLDAPIATFAAQVHQESRWRIDARSPVGAEGLAQFMPTTTEWIASAYPRTLANPQPYNPGWAMRALVQYDRWIFERLPITAQCERWAMVLSAYNGGLGWVQRDRKLASEKGSDQLIWFNSVEKFNAGRSAANFKENRHYPRIILSRWEPMYVGAGWGNGVCVGFKF